MLRRCVVLVLLLALVGAGCGGQKEPVEVVVSAAASMGDALKEIQTGFEAENPGVKLRLNMGSSGALQQQIDQGAPVDLFIAAAVGPMDALVKKGLVEQNAVRTLATNQVVLVRSKAGDGVVQRWEDLAGNRVQRIALGNPQHVPAGQYGKAVLEKLNLWGPVEKRLVLGEDARQVLNYVESGEVQAGLVYRTDAATSPKVTIVAEAPAGSHSPVVYPMAAVKGAREQAKRLADFLLSDRGAQVLRKYGFGPAQ